MNLDSKTHKKGQIKKKVNINNKTLFNSLNLNKNKRSELLIIIVQIKRKFS